MRLRMAVPVLAALLAGCSIDQPTECERAQAWVSAHGNALPTTLAEFGRYDGIYRHAIYTEGLNHGQRVSLWREHLDAFVLRHPELTTAQLRYIVRTQADLGQIIALRWSTDSTRIRAISDEAAQALGRLTTEAVVRLGAPGRVSPNMTVERCLCNSDRTDDCQSGSCDIGADCRITWFGCGPFYTWICDGMC